MDVPENLTPLPLDQTWTEIKRFPPGTSIAEVGTKISKGYPDAEISGDRDGGVVVFYYVETLCDCGEPAVFDVNAGRGEDSAVSCAEHLGTVVQNFGLTRGHHEFRSAQVTWRIKPQPPMPLTLGPAMNGLDNDEDPVVPSGT